MWYGDEQVKHFWICVVFFFHCRSYSVFLFRKAAGFGSLKMDAVPNNDYRFGPLPRWLSIFTLFFHVVALGFTGYVASRPETTEDDEDYFTLAFLTSIGSVVACLSAWFRLGSQNRSDILRRTDGLRAGSIAMVGLMFLKSSVKVLRSSGWPYGFLLGEIVLSFLSLITFFALANTSLHVEAKITDLKKKCAMWCIVLLSLSELGLSIFCVSAKYTNNVEYHIGLWVTCPVVIFVVFLHFCECFDALGFVRKICQGAQFGDSATGIVTLVVHLRQQNHTKGFWVLLVLHCLTIFETCFTATVFALWDKWSEPKPQPERGLGEGFL